MQILFTVGLWLVGQALVTLTGLPVPAPVVGLALTLILLAVGILKVETLSRGAGLLLAEMLLFFVPAVLAVIDHGEFIGWLDIKLLAIIVASTIAVMVTTSLTIELCLRWNPREVAA